VILASVHDKVHVFDHELEHRHAEHAPHDPAHPTAGSTVRSHGGQGQPAGQPDRWATGRLQRGIYNALYWASVFTAFLTALYTFRALCLTFYGEERIPAQAGHHAHESPPLMVAPLVALAIASFVVGVLCIGTLNNWGTNKLTTYLEGAPSLAAGAITATKVPAEFHLSVAGVGTVAALAGLVLGLVPVSGRPQGGPLPAADVRPAGSRSAYRPAVGRRPRAGLVDRRRDPLPAQELPGLARHGDRLRPRGSVADPGDSAPRRAVRLAVQAVAPQVLLRRAYNAGPSSGRCGLAASVCTGSTAGLSMGLSTSWERFPQRSVR
jgi:hypothetical protein